MWLVLKKTWKGSHEQLRMDTLSVCSILAICTGHRTLLVLSFTQSISGEESLGMLASSSFLFIWPETANFELFFLRVSLFLGLDRAWVFRSQGDGWYEILHWASLWYAKRLSENAGTLEHPHIRLGCFQIFCWKIFMMMGWCSASNSNSKRSLLLQLPSLYLPSTPFQGLWPYCLQWSLIEDYADQSKTRLFWQDLLVELWSTHWLLSGRCIEMKWSE